MLEARSDSALLMSGIKEWLNLRTWWRANAICHHCPAQKSSYVEVPSNLLQGARRDRVSFMADCIKPGLVSDFALDGIHLQLDQCLGCFVGHELSSKPLQGTTLCNASVQVFFQDCCWGGS